jgi:hypothetical protein
MLPNITVTSGTSNEMELNSSSLVVIRDPKRTAEFYACMDVDSSMKSWNLSSLGMKRDEESGMFIITPLRPRPPKPPPYMVEYACALLMRTSGRYYPYYPERLLRKKDDELEELTKLYEGKAQAREHLQMPDKPLEVEA